MIAINTDYINTKGGNAHTKSNLKSIAEAGFSHVHWCYEWNGTYQYSIWEMNQIKSWLDEYGLKVKGIHGTDGTKNDYFDDRKMFISPIEENRLAGVELVKNRVDLAKVTDAKVVVLHVKLFHMLLDEYKHVKDKYWQQIFKSFDEIIEYATKSNIKIAIENEMCPLYKYQEEQFDRFFDRYTKKDLGFCFDSGHGILTKEDNVLELLERYYDRLICVHLNDAKPRDKDFMYDYGCYRAYDKHYLPSDNRLDFKRLAKLIARSPYELPVVLEVSHHKGTINEFLQEAYNIGVQINNLVKEYREESK